MKDLTTKTGMRPRVLNPKAALIVAIVIASTCFGLNKLHHKRFAATLTFLRTKAFHELEKKDFRAAQQQLVQYLAFNPSDEQARDRLSWVLSEHIQTPAALEQAFRHNEDLLRNGSGDDLLRLRQARIASKLTQFSDADAHLKLLRASDSDNSEVWYLSGLCAEAARSQEEARGCFQRSIRCQQPIPEAFAKLASMASPESPEEQSAELLLSQMVDRCDSRKSWIIKSQFHFDREELSLALESLWKALETTSDADVAASLDKLGKTDQYAELDRLHSMLANSLQRLILDSGDATGFQSQLRKAEKYFTSRIEESPRDANLRLYLVAIHQKLGQRADAVKILEEGIRQNPRAFTQHTTLIDLLVDSGDLPHAGRLLGSIPDGGLPRDAAAYCRGRLLMAEKKWSDAIVCFEESIGFGAKKSGLLSRAQLSLAICRSHNTDVSSAVESFRTVVADNPESVQARLGMASAWVNAGQIDLAIAEYRSLTATPGVAPYLADLLIQKTAAQPLSLRDWSEIDELLREQDPIITDVTQRILLRADRLFASGQVIAAINTLENAGARNPQQTGINNALRRMHSKFAAAIEGRLMAIVQENPKNAEALAALIRQNLAVRTVAATDHSSSAVSTDGLQNAMKLLKDCATGRWTATANLSQDDRLVLVIDAIRHVINLERRLERDTYVGQFEEASVQYATTLAQQNSAFERQLVSALVHCGRTDDAINYLTLTADPANASHRGEAIVELVRASANRTAVVPKATSLMYELIRRHSEEMGLRVGYADLLLFGRKYEFAEQTLVPLAGFSGSEASVAMRRAWLRAAESKDLDEALKIADLAVKASNGDSASRETKARVLLSRGQFNDSLQELDSVGSAKLSLAGQIYRITALLNLDREPEATAAYEQIHISETDRLFPADQDLLSALNNRIRTPATQDKQEPQMPTRTAASGEKQI